MDDISLKIRRARRGNLVVLDLSNSGLTSWPSDLLKMKQIEDLNLSNNSLTNIPENISDLSALKNLNISNNLIASIPVQILELPSLQYFNLDGNPISLGNLSPGNIANSLSTYFADVKPDIQQQSFTPQFEDFTSSKINEFAKKLEEEKKQVEILKGALVKNAFQGVTEVEFNELELGEVISQGGFSVLHRGIWRGTQVAVKVIVDPIITPELRNEFENEVAMLNYLRHPHTVLLMSACNKPPKLAVVTEFYEGGTLFDLLHRSRENVDNDLKLAFARQIAQTFHFYHLGGVVHRDLKSLNVLLDRDFNIRICDFGLARFKNELNKGTMQFSGTPTYMAPELFKKQAYDEKVDVFAFGTLIWEIYAREIPYDGLDPGDIKEKILRGEIKLENRPNIPRKFLNLIDQCRSPNPGSRPSFQEIIAEL
ncbi:unnamed protein product [Blepharisma stoltei]|uniref:Protein kinase domain-containing protein n=1 Tax=Blepharisma stoltei TaxID=1481888 RepID=A0AAU9JJQ6_9CILI|nr:unnamed protein product [Blepharisma stoltei]